MVNGKPQPYNNYNTKVHDCYTDVSLLAEIIIIIIFTAAHCPAP